MGAMTNHLDSGRRVVLMVRELHRLGYGRLRLVPGMSPSGVYWRGEVTHAGNVLSSHGARARQYGENVASYTTGQDEKIFGWEDAATDTPADLAEKFMERFPEIAGLSFGGDEAYTTWFSEMIEATEPAGLVYAYSDWGDPGSDFLWVIGESRADKVPFPPPGEADG